MEHNRRKCKDVYDRTPNLFTKQEWDRLLSVSCNVAKSKAPESLGVLNLAKTEHSHPLGMVVSTHFRCGKGVKRGLKNGALPFNID